MAKKRKKEDLRAPILEAAKRLFLENGYAATSLRKIAGEVGISPTTIYLYYKDKAEIIHALHQVGFKILSDQFKTLNNVHHPFERLKAIGRCYINFALENRDFYEIMFIMQEPLKHLDSIKKQEGASKLTMDWPEGATAYQALLQVVEDCQLKGYFKNLPAPEMALLLWSNLHGICAFKNNGHLDLLAQTMDPQKDISNVLHSSFELYIKIIEKV